MTYTATPHDVPVQRTKDRIADLKSQERLLKRSNHPLAALDAAFARREAARLRVDLDIMDVERGRA